MSTFCVAEDLRLLALCCLITMKQQRGLVSVCLGEIHTAALSWLKQNLMNVSPMETTKLIILNVNLTVWTVLSL